MWSGWRTALAYVQPDTVVRWQRDRFRKFWARLSKVNRRGRGRPATAVEIRRLIERMVGCQSAVAGAQNSRRIENAQHRDL